MDSTEHSGLLKLALTHLSEAIILTDSQNRVVFSNPIAESLAGERAHLSIGHPLSEAFRTLGEKFVGLSERILREAAEGGSGFSLVLDSPANAARPNADIECSIHLMRDAAGDFRGAAILMRDFSRQRAAELALRSSEQSLLANVEALFDEKERAQVTLHSIGDAVFCTDFRGTLTYLNRMAETMIGRKHAECAGFAIDRVVRLVDVTTKQTLACPTANAIIEDRVVPVDRMCVLVGLDGTEIAAELSASPIHDKNGGVVGAVLVARDVTSARELSGRLERLALHDSLTELPNRALFGQRLEKAITHSISVGSSVGLLYIDLDRFKQINDTLGHSVGDDLLKAVSLRLRSCVKNTDTVSRQGGDEFVVVLFDVRCHEDVGACAGRILNELAVPCRIGEHMLNITASIGIAVYPDHAADAESLLRLADAALYQAKSEGRNTYRFFDGG